MAAQGPETNTYYHGVERGLYQETREVSYSPLQLIYLISQTNAEWAFYLAEWTSRDSMKTLPEAEKRRWLEGMLIGERARAGIDTLQAITNPAVIQTNLTRGIDRQPFIHSPPRL